MAAATPWQWPALRPSRNRTRLDRRLFRRVEKEKTEKTNHGHRGLGWISRPGGRWDPRGFRSAFQDEAFRTSPGARQQPPHSANGLRCLPLSVPRRTEPPNWEERTSAGWGTGHAWLPKWRRRRPSEVRPMHREPATHRATQVRPAAEGRGIDRFPFSRIRLRSDRNRRGEYRHDGSTGGRHDRWPSGWPSRRVHRSQGSNTARRKTRPDAKPRCC